MFLETDRLILRPPTTRDVDNYLEFCTSLFVLRYNAMSVTTREKVLALFSASQEEESTLVMEHKQLRKVIGVICIDDDSIRWGVDSKELSYFIHEAYSRHGYMKEALSAVIAHLFCSQPLECVAARSFSDNIASRKLLESLGFHQDGCIPRCVKGFDGIVFDDTLYSLFRHEFSPQNLNG